MSQQTKYRKLTEDEIGVLEGQGCCSDDWGRVEVKDGFEPGFFRNVEFFGQVKVGRAGGKIKSLQGIEKTTGIYNATIINCNIGDDVCICNVRVHIANYDIEDGVCIEDVGAMQTNTGATFGNGVEVSVLNEAGGREVVLFDELNVQFAYLMCLHRYRPKLIKQLSKIAGEYVKGVRSDRGKIGAGAKICSAKEIMDVNVGAGAVINGATSLINGTILSSAEAVTVVGQDVIAKDFIIAESASVTAGANIGKVFVGQGSQVGRSFSAEHCLFFANCEAFHGEACSVFAGPYTVTHHKSTLLIAGLLSFYNAGSGTNQSNHMYKLGPAHEGKLERGTKTGSFSYMLWPCNVGPFSVVLGKHMRNFDTSDFPFALIEADAEGKCNMVPGMNMTTVGTVRDGAKWPQRDRRKGSKRDIISFDVFSPYTVGKMIKASAMLKELQEGTDRSVEVVNIKGAQMKRVLLRTSQKFYRTGIEMYLGDKLLERISGEEKSLTECFADRGGVYSEDWVDIGGQLMPKQRLADLTKAIESGKIGDVKSFTEELQKIYEEVKEDEWLWIKRAYKEFMGLELEEASVDDIVGTLDGYLKTRTKFLNLVAVDAQKEFGEQSRMGFGRDGSAEDCQEDFRQVRGEYEENEFVKSIKENVAAIEKKVNEAKQKIAGMK